MVGSRFVLVLSSLLIASPATAESAAVVERVCFTPGDQCADVAIATIDRATRSIRVQAYSFTSAPIAKALIDAKKSGIDVQVILDKSNVSARYSAAKFLQDVGIPVFIDHKHAIAHNKVIIVDGTVVITGSYNFTAAAETHNAENMIVLKGNVARSYLDNWEKHREHSTPP